MLCCGAASLKVWSNIYHPWNKNIIVPKPLKNTCFTGQVSSWSVRLSDLISLPFYRAMGDLWASFFDFSAHFEIFSCSHSTGHSLVCPVLLRSLFAYSSSITHLVSISSLSARDSPLYCAAWDLNLFSFCFHPQFLVIWPCEKSLFISIRKSRGYF